MFAYTANNNYFGQLRAEFVMVAGSIPKRAMTKTDDIFT